MTPVKGEIIDYVPRPPKVGTKVTPVPTEWELEFNVEPICPYCGLVISATDHELYGEDEEEIECENEECEKIFLVYPHIEITYSTKKKE